MPMDDLPKVSKSYNEAVLAQAVIRRQGAVIELGLQFVDFLNDHSDITVFKEGDPETHGLIEQEVKSGSVVAEYGNVAQEFYLHCTAPTHTWSLLLKFSGRAEFVANRGGEHTYIHEFRFDPFGKEDALAQIMFELLDNKYVDVLERFEHLFMSSEDKGSFIFTMVGPKLKF